MNRLNIFYEHIIEGAEQKGITVREMLMRAKKCGIDGLECDHSRLSEKAKAKALFDECGMQVSCVYRFYDFFRDTERETEEKINDHLDTAAFFGADKAMCIPGFIGTDGDGKKAAEITARILGKFCSAAEKYGITVLIEDFDDTASPCCGTENIFYLTENVRGLKIAFDTGNFAYCMEDNLAALEKLQKYISHVHLKDRSYDISRKNSGSGKMNTRGEIMYPCEVGGGCANIQKIIQTLLGAGYTGDFSIEHFGAADQLLYMEKSAENVKKFCTGGKTTWI